MRRPVEELPPLPPGFEWAHGYAVNYRIERVPATKHSVIYMREYEGKWEVTAIEHGYKLLGVYDNEEDAVSAAVARVLIGACT